MLNSVPAGGQARVQVHDGQVERERGLIQEYLPAFSEILFTQDPVHEALQAAAGDHHTLGIARAARGEDDVPEIVRSRGGCSLEAWPTGQPLPRCSLTCSQVSSEARAVSDDLLDSRGGSEASSGNVRMTGLDAADETDQHFILLVPRMATGDRGFGQTGRRSSAPARSD